MKTIPKQVLEGLKSITDETVEQGIDNVKKAVGVVDNSESGQDLFPDIKDMTNAQKQQLEQSDQVKKQAEMAKLRQEMGQGRNVEAEIEEVRRQKEEEEKRKEEDFLENLKRQRMMEEQERQSLLEVQTPEHKKKKSRGSAFAHGKKPSTDQMSATGEFSKKPD